MNLSTWPFLAVCFLAISCGPTRKQSQASKDELFLGLEPIPESEALRLEINQLKKQISSLEAKVGVQEIMVDNLNNVARNFANISPTSKGYSPILTPSGFVFIACDDIKPYFDGQKLTLRLGNPSYASYSDIEIKATWGKSHEHFKNSSQEWSEQLRKKTFQVMKDIPPGKWVYEEIILSPAKPEELEYLSVEINLTSVKMDKPEPLENPTK